MSSDKRWYAVQTYSGHENKVQKLIQRRVEEEAAGSPAPEILDALRLTGHFLEAHVFAPHGRTLPAARGRLVDRLAAWATIS